MSRTWLWPAPPRPPASTTCGPCIDAPPRKRQGTAWLLRLPTAHSRPAAPRAEAPTASPCAAGGTSLFRSCFCITNHQKLSSRTQPWVTPQPPWAGPLGPPPRVSSGEACLSRGCVLTCVGSGCFPAGPGGCGAEVPVLADAGLPSVSLHVVPSTGHSTARPVERLTRWLCWGLRVRATS